MSDESTPKPEPNHRLARRRAITRKIRIEYRKGSMGLGVDIAISLLDVSEDGLGVRLKVAVTPGEETEIILTSPGTRKSYKLLGAVRWCRDAGDGTFLAGIQLRRRLAYADLSDLAR